ncbi:acyl-CoA carboxylase subunit beta [Nocardia sp. NPDC057663]|uniref:acyl-CoA carboxylase subunit beta n=1 Tax=Nocardia sp. NPDC057663 TaxID=3346201 RepID=UPI0036702E53
MEYPHERRHNDVLDAARPEAVAKQHARGKLTARERIALLVDPDSFYEIGALAVPDPMPGPAESVPADALVTGTGRIDGRPAVVIATDFTAAGGSNGVVGNEKLRRSWEIAAARGIPVVMLFDGGGHRLQEGLDARTFAGGFDIQQVQTRLSGWVPMVAAILGPGFGQPTLTASLCDYVVAVRGTASLGMAPPALVRAATGEEIDAESLYGADAQAGFGTIDLAVDTEEDALDALRWYLELLPANADQPPPTEHPTGPDPEAATRLDTVVPANLRVGYDMDLVIAGLVDEESRVDLKSAYAPNVITALARIEGRPIGIVANQPLHLAGTLDAPGARKAAHLISLCDAFAIPILVLMDLPGLAVGTVAEREGLARASAHLSLELGAATVPTFTVVARKGYGGGYVVMSGGRTYHPELVVAWPHAETAVMAVETAVELVYRSEIADATDPGAHRAQMIEAFQQRLTAIRAAEGFGVDVVLKPSQTRAWLDQTLSHLPPRRALETRTPRLHPVAPL